MITEGALNCYKLEKKAISNQLNGNINYIDPHRLKTKLLNLVTSKYDESYRYCRSNFHAEWVKDIISAQPVVTKDKLFLEHNPGIRNHNNYKL